MLKIVVYDSGYGGELFADKLQAELPVEVIRVIDWRNAETILKSKKLARRTAESALRPYLERVDLVVFANHLLSLTSLKYFQRRYQKQKFIGFKIEKPSTFLKHNVLILTTEALTKTIEYQNYLFHLGRKTKTLTLDDWPAKIDDGELKQEEINETLKLFLARSAFNPGEVVLACSQFNDIYPELKKFFWDEN